MAWSGRPDLSLAFVYRCHRLEVLSTEMVARKIYIEYGSGFIYFLVHVNNVCKCFVIGVGGQLVVHVVNLGVK
jgi:hypothetical protein